MATNNTMHGERDVTEQRVQFRRAAFSGVLGSSLEWYDFFLYGTASALVFNKLFFPSFAPFAGTMLAFATYAVGFVARPVGGIIAGHLGDRIGRRTTMTATLLIMGCSTVLIGLLPTYEVLGVWAPLLLVTLRFAQGLGLGGEWSGAVLMCVEHGTAERAGRNGSLPQLGVPLGNVLANGVLWIAAVSLPDADFLSWGWRIPFLLSGILVGVGFWMRVAVDESPAFRRTPVRARFPVVDVVRRYPRALLTVIGARLGSDIGYYLIALFALNFATAHTGHARETVLNVVLLGSLVQVALIPLSGALSDRYGRKPMYLVGAVSMALWLAVFFPLVNLGTITSLVVAVVVGLACHAAICGPQATFIAELFPAELRYSGSSVGYQAAGILGGGLAPMIALWLQETCGIVGVTVYAVLGMLITIACVLAARPLVEPREEPERAGV